MDTNKHEFILKEKSAISIIGPGVVGWASALALARAVGASAMEPAEAAAAGELVLLTVRDDALLLWNQPRLLQLGNLCC